MQRLSERSDVKFERERSDARFKREATRGLNRERSGEV
jgi:hypothetical protein